MSTLASVSNARADALALAQTLRQRRDRLAQQLAAPALLWAGQPSPRNFAANTYPFRPSSHFLYFAGLALPKAAIYLDQGRLTLFADEATPAAALWHGPSPSRADLAAQIGADAAYPLAELGRRIQPETATLPALDPATQAAQQAILGRPVELVAPSPDHQLAAAIVRIRLHHDAAALEQLRCAAAVSVAAHQAGFAATPTARSEAEVRAAMEQVIMANDMTCAYSSIVTTHGEVLHNEQYHHPLAPGQLLLADMGAETSSGWAADITRTWPTSGQFSSSQRDLYDAVLAAHDACIDQARPGVEYRELHLLACRVLAAALVELGILRGDPDGLVEQDAHALFFPHGVGHLLGLDVHDMEDLGDLAGYAPGRSRSDRFGLGFLRLDRPLAVGMAVTIEPGFYQVPGLLGDPARRDRYRHCVNWDRLEDFSDVRGIRIEDDVLITTGGCEVLTGALPTTATAIEQLMAV
jgi:Xaa-Pro aminopeptidase